MVTIIESVRTSKNFLEKNFCFGEPFHMETTSCLKYFVNNCGYSHMDIVGFRPVTGSSR